MNLKMNKWVTVLLIGFPGLGWGFDSPFVTFSKHFSFKEKFEIPGMPIVRDQRSLGICFSAAAAVLADFQFCKIRKINDCSQLPDDGRVSMLDLAKFSNMPDEDFDLSAASSYREWREGGSLYRTLRLAFIAGSVSTEKCAPMSRILNGKFKMATIEEREDFEFLEKIFNKVKSNPESCVECAAKEISARFPQITDIKYITNAFIKSKTLEAFHHRILVPRECAALNYQRGLYGKVASFPSTQEDSDERIPLSEYEKKIDEIIHSGRPIGVGNICMAEIETSKMTLGVCKDDKLRDQKEPPHHAVVISGVGTVCAQKDNCLKAYKVQNSWGQAWQDQYNDGWVVARELLSRINNSKKNISLVWIADRESDN